MGKNVPAIPAAAQALPLRGTAKIAGMSFVIYHTPASL
jgi:hypothetical protein